MSWSNIAVEIGRLMEVVSRAPRPSQPPKPTVARRLHAGVAVLVLVGALPVAAEVRYWKWLSINKAWEVPSCAIY